MKIVLSRNLHSITNTYTFYIYRTALLVTYTGVYFTTHTFRLFNFFQNKQFKMRTFLNVLGVLLVITGIGALAQGAIIGGIVAVICSFFFAPYGTDILMQKTGIKDGKGVRIALRVVLFIIIGASMPKPEGGISTTNQVAESTPEQPTETPVTEPEKPAPTSSGGTVNFNADGEEVSRITTTITEESKKEDLPEKKGHSLSEINKGDEKMHDWINNNVYPSDPWKHSKLIEKLGTPEQLIVQDRNPDIIKAFYFKKANRTIFTNSLKGTYVAWRIGKTNRLID